MKQNFDNSASMPNKFLGQLARARDKKKMVITVFLIGLMAFMWARLLGKDTAESVQAVAMPDNPALKESRPQLKISFIELTEAKGRSDRLSRDFFNPNGWTGFSRDASGNKTSGSKKIELDSQYAGEEIIQIEKSSVLWENEVAGLTASNKSSGGIQSISFKKDMDIRDALHFLSARYQKNIVPSSGVTGRLAFTSLFDVTFEEAMGAILDVKFEYEREGNLIRVYTAEEYKRIKQNKERMITRVFSLCYISAAEAAKLISVVISDSGRIQASSPAETDVPAGESISSDSTGGDTIASHNMIVIRDFPERIAEAEKLLKDLEEASQLDRKIVDRIDSQISDK